MRIHYQDSKAFLLINQISCLSSNREVQMGKVREIDASDYEIKKDKGETRLALKVSHMELHKWPHHK
jgi:hypothetical protein